MHWAEVIHYSFKWAIPMVLVSFTSKLGWATFKYFLLVLWNLVKVDHLDFFVILESEKNVGVNLFGLNFQKMAWTSRKCKLPVLVFLVVCLKYFLLFMTMLGRLNGSITSLPEILPSKFSEKFNWNPW